MTTPNTFDRSTWRGTRYRKGQRTIVLDEPSLIFACPLCEYRMTALAYEGIDAIRRAHVRTVHPSHVAELVALDSVDAAVRQLDYWMPLEPRHLNAHELDERDDDDAGIPRSPRHLR